MGALLTGASNAKLSTVLWTHLRAEEWGALQPVVPEEPHPRPLLSSEQY